MKIDDIIKTRFESPQVRAVVNIRYTSNYMATLQNQFMSQYDLTMPQFNILRILRGAKSIMSVNVVKDRMVEKSPNTTRLMDKLIEKGLISRERCENDRRVVYVKITQKGLDLLTTIDKELKKKELFSVNLSDQEAELLSELLDKLRGE